MWHSFRIFFGIFCIWKQIRYLFNETYQKLFYMLCKTALNCNQGLWIFESDINFLIQAATTKNCFFHFLKHDFPALKWLYIISTNEVQAKLRLEKRNGFVQYLFQEINLKPFSAQKIMLVKIKGIYLHPMLMKSGVDRLTLHFFVK